MRSRDSTLQPARREGRNEPCPCGSGRKYKHCCLRSAPAGVQVAGASQSLVLPSYEQALRHRAVGMMAEAEASCREALRQDPYHPGASRMLAEFAMGAGRIAEATDLLTRAVRGAPTDPDLHNNLGTALRNLGRLEEAERAHRKALQLNPLHAPAHQGLGELFRVRGQFEVARACFETALDIDPHLVPARIELCNTFLDLGEFQAAADGYQTVLAAGNATPLIYINLGSALKELGNTESSQEAFRHAMNGFQRAVTRNPHSWEGWLSLGSIYLELGRVTDARDSFREAIRLRGDLGVAHVLYGAALAALGDFEGALVNVAHGLPPGSTRQQAYASLAARLLGLGLDKLALDCFKRLLLDYPGDAAASHFVEALSGRNPDHPAETYVRDLFDQASTTFDHQLLSVLGYRAPSDLVEALLATGDSNSHRWDVLDLGCGTGLVGRAIAPHAGNLVGIDLSPKMISRAAECKVYTRLETADLSTALRNEAEASYDVITSADVFIYVGNLDAVVPAIRRLMRLGGLFAFTVEAAEFGPGPEPDEGVGYRLRPSGRYAHFQEYLRSLAAQNTFEIKSVQQIRLRTEHRRPILGWMAVWQAFRPA